MRGTAFFFFASIILPTLAAPVLDQHSTSFTTNADLQRRDLEERAPIIEAIPVQERNANAIDDKDADLETKVLIERLQPSPELQSREEELDEKRAVRGQGFRGGRRSFDERAIRGPGYTGGRRSLDERAVRGGGYKGGRSLDERAVRGQGFKGGKRSPDERAVRGGGYKGGRSVDERAVRGQGFRGGRRSIAHALGSLFG